MKTQKQNARKIRGGAWLMLIAAVATGFLIVLQTIGPVLPYPRTAVGGAVTALLIFVTFVAGGVGAWLAFTGMADELEAGAG